MELSLDKRRVLFFNPIFAASFQTEHGVFGEQHPEEQEEQAMQPSLP